MPKPVKPAKPTFYCPVCGKPFKLRIALSRHLRTCRGCRMPYADPAKQREYDQQRLFDPVIRERRNAQQRAVREWRREQLPRTEWDGSERAFVGCDGEGMGQGLKHRLHVFRMGGQCLISPEPLTADDVFAFIAAQDPRLVYVIFSGTYDCTMILRSLPADVIGQLFHRTERTRLFGNGREVVMPVPYKDWLIDYIPKKRLTVQPRGGRAIDIHETFGFFQQTFVTAIEAWQVGTEEERALVKAGKERRGDVDVTSPEELRYNEIECKLLGELMGRVNDACRSVGLDPKPYEGAGNLAGSLYRKYVARNLVLASSDGGSRVPNGNRRVPMAPEPPSDVPYLSAYYGGRFEITGHGPVRRPVYEYDICSAYPYAIANLPCLWHGRWVHRNDDDATCKVGYIRWSRDPFSRIHPYAQRMRDGRVVFPARGAGWYWHHEWYADSEVQDVWSFIPHQSCACRPFDFVESIYQARKRMGKSGRGYVLKLALNSLYGKTAQSIGKAPWRNMAYAGLITSKCRSMLWHAAMQAPDDILMMATDGIYSLSPLTLDEGEQLGQWESHTYDDMHLVMPGIYFTSDETKVKTRGIGYRTVVQYRDEIIAAFGDGPVGTPPYEEWSCEVSYNGLVTLRAAYAQGNLARAGYFGPLTRRIGYGYLPKRRAEDAGWVDGIWRTYPPYKVAKAYGYDGSAQSPDHEDEEAVEAAQELRLW